MICFSPHARLATASTPRASPAARRACSGSERSRRTSTLRPDGCRFRPRVTSRCERARVLPARRSRAIDYVASFGGPADPQGQPEHGSLSEGKSLFALNCAGCHRSSRAAAIVTGGVAPPLSGATTQQIGEAIRVGPYLMPRFSPGSSSTRHRLDRALRHSTQPSRRPRRLGHRAHRPDTRGHGRMAARAARC